MTRYATTLVGLPFGEPTMTKWYQLYKETLSLEDLSLFSRREDKGILTMGGGNIAYNTTTFMLSWDNVIQVVHPFTKDISEIGIGSTAVEFDSYVYINLKRTATNNGGSIAPSQVLNSSKLPNNDLFHLLFYITPTGAVVTNIDNSIAVNPVESMRYIPIDKVNTYDFPNNPIVTKKNNNISTLLISDTTGSLKDKGISIDIATPSDFITGDFNLNFILIAGAITRDIYFDLSISKNSIGGSSIASNILSLTDIHFTPSALNEVISFSDSNIFELNPSEFISIEILFKNSDIGNNLGNVTDIELMDIYLSSNN